MLVLPGIGGIMVAVRATRMPVAIPRLDRLAAILPDSQRVRVVRQCSRRSPDAGEAGWVPDAKTIANIEGKLADYLRKSSRQRIPDPDAIVSGSARQYVGIVRRGHRFVYGNFFPASETKASANWRTQAMIVCDGGRALFGVEFDSVTGRITSVDFNGAA
jgi:hypothetical protein